MRLISLLRFFFKLGLNRGTYKDILTFNKIESK